MAHAKVRSLAAGQRLFAYGDPADGLYFVVAGAIRMTSSSADGKEALLAFAETPQWFGEVALFDALPRAHDAWIETDVVLLHIGQQDAVRFLDENPVHWKAVGLLMAPKLRLAFEAIGSSVLMPVPVRLARRLLAIAGGYGERHGLSKRVINVQQEHRRGFFQRLGAARHDHHIHAFGSQRVSAGKTEALAGATHQRMLAAQS